MEKISQLKYLANQHVTISWCVHGFESRARSCQKPTASVCSLAASGGFIHDVQRLFNKMNYYITCKCIKALHLYIQKFQN